MTWLNNIKQNPSQSFWFVVLTVFLFGLAAHAYCYFNMTYSHDSLYSLVRSGNYVTNPLAFGRFMQGPYLAIRGAVTAPWLVGFLSLFFISVAAFLLLRLFKVSALIPSVLICGFMATNIVVTSTNASYVHDADMYMLSLLLSVASAFFIQRGTKPGICASVLVLVLSMGFYQAYVSVAAVLFLSLLMRDVLEGSPLADCLRKGLTMLGVLVVAFVLYYLCMRLSLAITGVAASTGYNSVSKLGDYSEMSLFAALAGAWEYSLQYLLNPEGIHPFFQKVSNVLLLLFVAACMFVLARRNKISAGHIGLLVALFALLPLAANIAFAASQGVVHTLMVYGILLFHPLTLILADHAVGPQAEITQLGEAVLSFVQFLVWALCAVLILFNIVGANQAYVLKQLQFEATESVMTRVIDRIEETDGYVAGETPILFIGTLTDSDLFIERQGFEDVGGVGFFGQSSVTYDMESFITKVLGYSAHVISSEEATGKVSLADVSSMGCFPDADSCKLVNGVLVVKFTDEIDETTQLALS